MVLPESLTDAQKKDVTVWRNQDQNENQALTDGELIRMCLVAVQSYLAKAKNLGMVGIPPGSHLHGGLHGDPAEDQHHGHVIVRQVCLWHGEGESIGPGG